MFPVRRPQAAPDAVEDRLESQFRAAYRANYREIRRYVGRLSGTTSIADDVTQEAFVRLWCELSSGTEIVNPRAWVYKVAGRLVLSRARTLQRRGQVERPGREDADDLPSTSNPETRTTQRDLVRRALSQLPTPMRQCLLLYHAGLTGKEIAGALDIKASYVGTLVMRGHERFRRECAALGVVHPFKRE